MSERKGNVVSYHTEKKYGFVTDTDGNSHFIHINDVLNTQTLMVGQEIEFDTKPTPKGSRAINARADLSTPRQPRAVQEQEVYVDPDRFIMTRESEVRGYEILCVIDRAFWARSNNPNEAKEMLKKHALALGGNAVVALNVEPYTESEGCSNYKYTMHHITGVVVYVKRKIRTSDPEVIEAAHAAMEVIAKYNEEQDQIDAQRETERKAWGGGQTKMVKPPALVVIPKLLFSWSMTFGEILYLLTRHAIRRISASR
tara:strand:- start:986 stop:1753 length:768 start_codon:yes stop_codon:yes gene_type:complete